LVCSPTGDVLAAADADPRLMVVDVDLDSVEKARDTVAVLRNRTEFAPSGRAQSLG
jgi:predicted amidohydrolase